MPKKNHLNNPDRRLAALSFVLGSLDGNAIQLFPAGQFDAPRGAMMGQGPWFLDADVATAVIVSVSTRANDILVDYEHQSLLSAKNGKEAPAAGWIKPGSLVFDETKGLLATAVQWTDKAKSYIAAKEYRYISPVFYYDAATGAILDVISVALTNTPAIDGMDEVALAAAALLIPSTQEESSMDELLERLRYLLNLPLTSTPEEISVELDKLKAMITGGGAVAATSLAAVLASKDSEIAALQSAAPNPELFVPIAALSAANEELAALRAEKAERDIESLIGPALGDGRLLPAQEQWARDLGNTNVAALSAFLQTAQPIAALTGMQTGGNAPTGVSMAALSDSQIANMARAYHKEQTDKGVNLSFTAAVDAVKANLHTGVK